MEEWKKIKDFENYSVSSEGRVRNDITGKILKQHNKRGYLEVCIFNNGKRKFIHVHRLVAQAFIPNPENKPQVNHIDENKTNNCVDNLNWMTSKENVNWGTATERMLSTKGLKPLTPEEDKKYHQEWYIRNKERLQKKHHEYYLNNKEDILKKSHEYYNNNKEKWVEWGKKRRALLQQ